MNARDIMTAPTVTLSPDQTVGDAVRCLSEAKSPAIPVADKSGTLVGAIGTWQILQQVLPAYILSGELRDVRYAPDLGQFHERLAAVRHKPIAEFMDTAPPTVHPHDSVLECAALLFQRGQRMPLLFVVEEPRRLVGLIGLWDVIKEIRPDAGAERT